MTDLRRRHITTFGSALALCLGACGDSGSMTGTMDMREPTGDAMVRIAHYTAGAPAFDVCIKGPSDATFQGPLVKGKLQRTGGVPEGYLSGYFALAPAVYTVRVVPGTSMNCDTPLGGLPDVKDVDIRPGRYYTEAAFGNLNLPRTIQLKTFEDDRTVTAGSTRLRFLNGVPDLASLDLGQSPSGTYMPLVTGAGYGAAGSATAGTYASFVPVANVNLVLRETGNATNRLTTNALTLEAGTVLTAAAVGVPGDPISPLQIVLCNDLTDAKMGLADCKQLQ